MRFFIFFWIIPLNCMGALLGAVETTINGGTVELKNKGQVVYFSGGVELNRGGDNLKAQEMETTKARDHVEASGEVQFLRLINDKEKLKGFGQKGFYETRKGTAWLEGGREAAHLIYSQLVSSTQTKFLDIFADRFDFDKDRSFATAHGRVYGKTIDPDTADVYEFWSEKAVYQGDEKKVILSGASRPRVKQTSKDGTRFLRGTTITYFMESKRLLTNGSSEGIFVDQTEKGN